MFSLDTFMKIAGLLRHVWSAILFRLQMFLIAKRHQNRDPWDLEKWCITPFHCEELPGLKQIYWIAEKAKSMEHFGFALESTGIYPENPRATKYILD
jgi:hypothetical protein